MSLPRGAVFLLRALVPADRVEDALGDLEEVHRERVARRGRWLATILTSLEAVEIAAASGLLRMRLHRVVPMSWIDFKLGVRMLVKYPGLTLVGGLAMAFGIFVGTACYEFYSQVLHPRLTLDEGERVVAFFLLDDRDQGSDPRVLHDFAVWRTELSAIQELGAADARLSNLVTGGGRGEPIVAAAMTASAFHMTRVPALMGRTLVAADESPSASLVVVVGYDVWQTRFGADPDILGRTVRVDEVEHTIVGVMPPGFGFPVNQSLWTPLRVDSALEPLQGPGVSVFGRLAPGMTIDMARDELDRYVALAAIEYPEAYRHLHALVLPYAEAAFFNVLAEGDGVEYFNVFAGLFLVLVCGNVALLMFARAAAREGEIVVRAALGASRWRIVSQFFFEALVLGTAAGLVGVSAVGWGLERFVHAVLGGQLPTFWYHTSLSPRTLVYAALLTLFAAVIAGVIPGLKITSGDLDSRLRRQTYGGDGLRFGGVWTAVIVLQIAATLTFPVVGWFVRQDSVHIQQQDFGFASTEYLTFGLRLNRGPSDATWQAQFEAHEARLARTVRALSGRLEAEASIGGVTMTRTVPGTHHVVRRVEMDDGGEAPRNEWDEMGGGRRLRGGLVAPNFFEVLGAAPVQGRTFNTDDADPEARTVVVNQPFVDEVLGGRNPIGRRLRYLSSNDYLSSFDEWDGVELGDEPGPWYRIVGVVPYLGMDNGRSPHLPRAGLYHAVSPGSLLGRTRLLVRVNGDAPAFATRLREIAAEVEPDIAVVDLQPLDAVKDAELRPYAFQMWLIVWVSGLAMLLSLAGIYSVTAFTVTRRTREIGVRVALGAGPARVAGAIFRRPLMQIAAGIVVGLWFCVLLGWGLDAKGLWGKPLVVLLSYTAVMTAVCLLACVVPMRRALSVEPTEALAADG